jgi:hypothetical protein
MWRIAAVALLVLSAGCSLFHHTAKKDEAVNEKPPEKSSEQDVPVKYRTNYGGGSG